jgi:ABC-type glycerol-3-phosphate transport system permease component
MARIGVAQEWAVRAALAATLPVMIFPLFWMVSTALKAEREVATWPPTLWPTQASLANFATAWQVAPFGRFFLNSAVIAVVGTALVLLLCSLAGFAFAVYEFPFKGPLFMLVLTTLMVPYQVVMIPVFILLRDMGLLNTFAGVILPGLANAFGVYLMRQYIATLPRELFDAARIDGCGELGIYWRIAMPLARPALASLTILTFLWEWNGFLWPLIALRSQDMFTWSLGVMTFFQEEWSRKYHLAMAVSLVGVLPVLVVFLAFQREFVRGVALSGIKG